MLTGEAKRKHASEVANFYLCFIGAIFGAGLSVFFAIVIGLEDIAGAFGGIGFFVSIIIYKVHKKSLVKIFYAMVE